MEGMLLLLLLMLVVMVEKVVGPLIAKRLHRGVDITVKAQMATAPLHSKVFFMFELISISYYEKS